MPKFNLAVLLKVQSLWLNTLVFFYMHLVALCNDTSCAIDGARRACERTSVCIIAFDLGVYQLVPKGV